MCAEKYIFILKYRNNLFFGYSLKIILKNYIYILF
jgi:hypothetical protein